MGVTSHRYYGAMQHRWVMHADTSGTIWTSPYPALFTRGKGSAIWASKKSENSANEQFQNFYPTINLSDGPNRQEFFLQIVSCANFAYHHY